MPHFTAHAARRGCSTILTDTTGNAAIAQRALGHATLETTLSHYYSPEHDQLNAAVNQVDIPALLRKSADEVPADDAPPPLERILSALAAMQQSQQKDTPP